MAEDETNRYAAAVEALERAHRFGMNPSLAGIRALTEVLGRPQEAYRTVQVTGTNGKTSVTRMVAALLEAHGRSAGAYTSPHLVDYTERIEIGGTPVSRNDFARAAEAALAAGERVAGAPLDAVRFDDRMPDAAGRVFTEFELLTAAALWLLRERGVAWAVLEVGMGGRWDATSVVEPAVAVVTGVALDHMRHLGETIGAIAEDKSHVIRSGSTAILGPETLAVDAVLLARASEAGSPVVRVREAASVDARGEEATGADALVTYTVVQRPDRPGGTTCLEVRGAFDRYAAEIAAPSYQAANAAVALAAAEAALGSALEPGAVRRALGAMRFPGRFDVLRREPSFVIADGAHNPNAATTLAEALAEAFGCRRPSAVLAVLDDKDAAGIVAALQPHVAGFVVTSSDSSRALAVSDLAEVVLGVTGVAPRTAAGVAEAIELAVRDGDVVVAGSLTTAGEAVRWARGEA